MIAVMLNRTDVPPTTESTRICTRKYQNPLPFTNFYTYLGNAVPTNSLSIIIHLLEWGPANYFSPFHDRDDIMTGGLHGSEEAEDNFLWDSHQTYWVRIWY